MVFRTIILLLLAVSLTACLSNIRPGAQGDSAPRTAIDVSNIPEVVPQPEDILRSGNYSPYTVLGATYEVMPSSRGYRETGYASWYGSKFHGRLTSNGEIYNMYQITAAHKTLPIPAYVLVRNLENGQELIVRVNDRGPFHDDRIIDLSWAAASKLGFADSGVAQVEVVALDPNNYQITLAQLAAENNPAVEGPLPLDASGPVLSHLQIAALSSPDAAEALAETVETLADVPVEILSPTRAGDFYRVFAGPVAETTELDVLQTLLELNGLPAGYLVDYDAILLANCGAGSDSSIC
jgi:rare lipoprotein A